MTYLLSTLSTVAESHAGAGATFVKCLIVVACILAIVAALGFGAMAQVRAEERDHASRS